ncbi:MAG: hypothetical protein JSR49_14610 [Proteobacteria bacterium]|nr:hypothetical protein [Pseudomonadota bacterium]
MVSNKKVDTLLLWEQHDASLYYDEKEKTLERVEPAWAKAALFFRTWEHFGHPPRTRRMRGLVQIHTHLGVFKKQFEGGDTMALLHAIGVCADENLPLPTWLAIAYREALNRFLQPGGANSLDEVFFSGGLPTNTPKKRAVAKIDWQTGGEIWRAVWRAVVADESLASLDAALDRVLAERDYGVKKTKARRLVLMIDRNQQELLGNPPSKHISPFLKKRRKR